MNLELIVTLYSMNSWAIFKYFKLKVLLHKMWSTNIFLSGSGVSFSIPEVQSHPALVEFLSKDPSVDLKCNNIQNSMAHHSNRLYTSSASIDLTQEDDTQNETMPSQDTEVDHSEAVPADTPLDGHDKETVDETAPASWIEQANN